MEKYRFFGNIEVEFERHVIAHSRRRLYYKMFVLLASLSLF